MKEGAELVKTASELEIEPEGMTELLQSHDKILIDELLLMSKESGFLR